MFEFCSEFHHYMPRVLFFFLPSSFSNHSYGYGVRMYKNQTESQFILKYSRCECMCVLSAYCVPATATTTNSLSINFPNVSIQLLLSGNLYLCNVLQHHFSITHSLTHAPNTVKSILLYKYIHSTLILYRFKSNQNEVSLTEITLNVSLILHFVWNWFFFFLFFEVSSFWLCMLFFSAIAAIPFSYAFFSSRSIVCCWFVPLFVRRLHVDDYDEKRCSRIEWVQE